MKRLGIKLARASLLAALLIGLTASVQARAQQLVTAPAGLQTLSEAWQWALDQTDTGNGWIVWQITSVLDERVVPNDFYGGQYYVSDGVSLGSMLAGNARAQQPYARQQDLLIMVLVETGRLSRLQVSSPHRLQQWRYPVYWLDEASSDESFRLLSSELEDNLPPHVIRQLIYALGLHNHADRTAFLSALHSEAPWEAFRSAIVTSLALQQSAESQSLIVEIAADERAGLAEREAAIRALGRYRSAVALALLRAMTDEKHPRALRDEAIKAMAHFDAEQVEESLISLAWFDGHAGIRETAVESLARLATASANAQLLEIARDHPSADTREAALENLRDSLF